MKEPMDKLPNLLSQTIRNPVVSCLFVPQTKCLVPQEQLNLFTENGQTSVTSGLQVVTCGFFLLTNKWPWDAMDKNAL